MDDKKLDLLVLEDTWMYWNHIEKKLPEGLNYKRVRTGQEFVDFLESGGRAKIYSLDDTVIDADGKYGPHFIKHCDYLRSIEPNARVLYHGSSPQQPQFDYMKAHDVKRVDEHKLVGFMVRKMLS